MAQVPQQRFGCYIGNIDRSVTLEVLRQVFSQCGTIIDCSLNGRDEDPYRYGFIDFASEDDRARAMKYNGFTLAGRKIKVGVSKGNVGRPEGFNSSGSNNNSGNTNNNNNSSSNNNTNNNNGNNSNNNNMNSGNNNNNNNSMIGGMGNHQPPMQQPHVPPMGLSANFLPSVVQQQQQSAQLLVQLIQQGAIDVNNLTPEQQQILMASLIPQMVPPPTPGISAIPPAAPMGYPPIPHQQQPWGAPRGACTGGFQGGPPMGRGMPYGRGPANPMPSEETVKLREVQRKQFLDVVRRDAEKYEKKLQERSVKEGRAGSASGSDGSFNGENEDQHQQHEDEKVEKKPAERERNDHDENDNTNTNNDDCMVVEDEKGETEVIEEFLGADDAEVPVAADDCEQI